MVWMNAVVSFDLYTKKIIKDKESKYAIIAIHGFNGDENSFDPVVELINFNKQTGICLALHICLNGKTKRELLVFWKR